MQYQFKIKIYCRIIILKNATDNLHICHRVNSVVLKHSLVLGNAWRKLTTVPLEMMCILLHSPQRSNQRFLAPNMISIWKEQWTVQSSSCTCLLYSSEQSFSINHSTTYFKKSFFFYNVVISKIVRMIHYLQMP